MPKNWLMFVSGVLAIAVSFIEPGTKVFAQNITLDGSLGTLETLTGPNYTIPQSAGQTVGNNLFHSFGKFNLNSNEAAIFQSNANIQNILSRVTGGNQSVIDGLISTQSGVNLFFINPSGIIFGQNARLDVGGSFVASTANAIGFENLGFFSATDKNLPSPLLTINPSALLFNQINQNAAIQNNSIAPAGTDLAGFNTFGLRVPDGKSLLLVGGNVSMEGGWLNAFGGRIELGGLAEPGNVNLLFDGNNLRLGFPENVARKDVLLTEQARILVQAAGGGEIAVNARNIEILQSSRIVAGIGYGVGSPESQAGDMTLNATGTIQGDNAVRISNIVDSGGQGKAGNINITAESLSLNNGTQISASIFGKGNAGNINIEVQKDIAFNGIDSNGFASGAFSTVEDAAQGQAGNINIATDSISLINGARLSTNTLKQGDAGNITVNARKNIYLDGVSSNGFLSGIFNNVLLGAVGKGGNIHLTTGRLSLTNGAQIIAATFGQGDAGNISIDADTIYLRGVTSNGAFPSGIFSSVENQQAVGNGGNITLNVNQLSLNDGGRVSASTLGRGNTGNITIKAKDILLNGIGGNNFRSGIFNDILSGAIGDGGDIIVFTDSLFANNGARLSAINAGKGNAGNVRVNANDTVSLAGNARILSTVEAGGVGNGGNIDINGATFSLTDGAQVQTLISRANGTQPAGQGNAGNVNVKVSGTVDIAGQKSGFDSGIRSFVGTGAQGNGGNITIDAGSLTLKDGAFLQASTFGQGNAGNVRLKINGTIDIANRENGTFNASIATSVGTGAQGKGGNITIDAASLKLKEGAGFETSTYGQGNAGNVVVNAKDSISLTDAAIFSRVEAGSVGNGGNIDINGATLSLTDGALLQTIISRANGTQPAGKGNAGNVNVKTSGTVDIVGPKSGSASGIISFVDTGAQGDGGNITIDAASLKLQERAQIIASTYGRGNAGNVNVKTSGTVDMAGSESGSGSLIISTVGSGGRGNGGNITIDAASLRLQNGARFSASTYGRGNAGTIKVDASDVVTIFGKNPQFNSGLYVESQTTTGTAGDIIVTSPKIILDNQAKINANSLSVNGGNINLNSDLLLLRRGSKVSTNAGTEQKGGNGGNIDINSIFIVAVPSEDSDITANAFDGKGGNIRIGRNQGIFGIEARLRESPTTSDITASSENGAPGEISITQPDTDPSRGLTELPINLVDVSQQIAQGCTPRGKTASRFISTGRRGIPENPYEPLRRRAVITNWVTATNDGNQQTREINEQVMTQPTPKTIVEAQGWVINSRGEVEFVSPVSGGNAHNSSQQATLSCNAAASR